MLNNVLAIIGVIAAIFGIVIPIYKYLIGDFGAKAPRKPMIISE